MTTEQIYSTTSDKKLSRLGIVAAVLFVTSLIIYNFENKRGTDLVSGSEFITSFDVDNVAKVVIKKCTDAPIVLERNGPEFFISSFNSFPASSQKINSLFFDIANIIVAEKVSHGKSEFARYGVTEDKNETDLSFFDSSDKILLRLFVGDKNKGKESGNYIRRDGEEVIYRSKAGVNISANKDAYMDKQIIHLEEKDVESISLKNGEKIVKLVKKDGKTNVEVTKGRSPKIEDSKAQSIYSAHQQLNFTEALPATDPLIRRLDFKKEHSILLKNAAIYKLSLATEKDKNGEKYYLKTFMEIPGLEDGVRISRDDNTEQLKAADEKLQTRDRAKKFNEKFGPWVFELSKSKFEQLTIDKVN